MSLLLLNTLRSYELLIKTKAGIGLLAKIVRETRENGDLLGGPGDGNARSRQ